MIKINRLLSICLLFVCLFASCDEDDENVGPESPAAANIATVAIFLDLLAEQNPELLTLFSESPMVTLKMNPDGTQTGQTFMGTEQVQGYWNRIFFLFSEISFNEVRITASEDGKSVFSQFNGVFEVESTEGSYNNVYISRLDFNDDGEITAVEEYLNPVITGVSLAVALGACEEVICN